MSKKKKKGSPEAALTQKVGEWVAGKNQDFLKLQHAIQTYTNEKLISLEEMGRQNIQLWQGVLKAVNESGRSDEDKEQMRQEVKKAIKEEGDKIKFGKQAPHPQPEPEPVVAPSPAIQPAPAAAAARPAPDPQKAATDELIAEVNGACNAQKAQDLIKGGANINVQDKHGSTPLHLALNKPNGLGAAQALIEAKADLNVPNRHGQTPLDMAILSGNAEAAEALLNAGASHNTKGHHGITPLHLAVKGGNQDIINILLEKGADPNAQNQFGQTPLHFAAMARSNEAIEALIAHGADKAIKDRWGREFAHRKKSAAERDELEQLADKVSARSAQTIPAVSTQSPKPAVEVQSQSASVVNEPTPIQAAAAPSPAKPPLTPQLQAAQPAWQGMSQDSIEKLAGMCSKSQGGSIDDWRNTLNDLNSEKNKFSAVGLADGTQDQRTMLHVVAQYGDADLMNEALKFHDNINARDAYGDTPLHLAAALQKDHANVIQVLIDKGADLNARGLNEETPLEAAKGNPVAQAIIQKAISAQAQSPAQPSLAASITPAQTSAVAVPASSFPPQPQVQSAQAAQPAQVAQSQHLAEAPQQQGAKAVVKKGAKSQLANTPAPNKSMSAKEIQAYQKAMLDIAGQQGKNDELKALLSVVGVGGSGSRPHEEAVGIALKNNALENANLFIEKGAKIQLNDLAQLCEPKNMSALSPEAQGKICGVLADILVKEAGARGEQPLSVQNATAIAKPKVTFEEGKFQFKNGDQIQTADQKVIEELIKRAQKRAAGVDTPSPQAPAKAAVRVQQQQPAQQQQRPMSQQQPVQQQLYALFATGTPGVFVQVPVITPAQYRQNLNDQMDKFLASEKDRFFALQVQKNPNLKEFKDVPEKDRKQFEIYEKGQIARKENLLQQNFLQEEMATTPPGQRREFLLQKFVELQQIQQERDREYYASVDRAQRGGMPYDPPAVKKMDELQYKQNPLIFEGHIDTVRDPVKRTALNPEMLDEIKATAGKDAKIQAKEGAVNASVVFNNPKEAQEFLQKMDKVHNIKGRNQEGKRFYPLKEDPGKCVVYITPGEVQKVKESMKDGNNFAKGTGRAVVQEVVAPQHGAAKPSPAPAIPTPPPAPVKPIATPVIPNVPTPQAQAPVVEQPKVPAAPTWTGVVQPSPTTAVPPVVPPTPSPAPAAPVPGPSTPVLPAAPPWAGTSKPSPAPAVPVAAPQVQPSVAPLPEQPNKPPAPQVVAETVVPPSSPAYSPQAVEKAAALQKLLVPPGVPVKTSETPAPSSTPGKGEGHEVQGAVIRS